MYHNNNQPTAEEGSVGGGSAPSPILKSIQVQNSSLEDMNCNF